MEKKRDNKKGTYWYMFYCDECVLCGHEESGKYRIYDRPKPTKTADRYDYTEHACAIHFM